MLQIVLTKIAHSNFCIHDFIVQKHVRKLLSNDMIVVPIILFSESYIMKYFYASISTFLFVGDEYHEIVEILTFFSF